MILKFNGYVENVTLILNEIYCLFPLFFIIILNFSLEKSIKKLIKFIFIKHVILIEKIFNNLSSCVNDKIFFLIKIIKSMN